MNDYYTKKDFINELDLDQERYDKIPSNENIQKTVKNIEDQNIEVKLVKNKEKALNYLKKTINEDITINMGHSTTLEEIGFIDYLKNQQHPWKNWNNKVRSIDNEEKRMKARREGMVVNTFLDSPNAISKSGELIGVNAGGSGIGAWPYSAKNLILVSGVNKIVESWQEAINRVKKFVLPLENQRALKTYGSKSKIGKMISYEFETTKNRTKLLLIKKRLGF